MRPLSPAHAARLGQAVQTLALAWRLTRADGLTLAFTDHDRAVTLDGVVHTPVDALAAGPQDARRGLAIDGARLTGAVSSAAITAEDLAAGHWDAARIAVWRFDWESPDLHVKIFDGALGEVRQTANGFEVDALSTAAALQRPVGRTYARTCDAELGDARCGVAMTGARSWSTTIASAPTRKRIIVSGAAPSSPSDFEGGVVIAAGRRARIATLKANGGDTQVDLDAPLSAPAGASVTVQVGCDKSFATCRDRFANALNFRGFPDMPGPDAVILSAGLADDADGGSRRSG